MKLKSLMKVLTEVRYDIIATETNTGFVTVHKFDYVSGGMNARDVMARYQLMGRGAEVTDIANINCVMTIRVNYTIDDEE